MEARLLLPVTVIASLGLALGAPTTRGPQGGSVCRMFGADSQECREYHEASEYAEVQRLMKKIIVLSTKQKCPQHYERVKGLVERGKLSVTNIIEGDIILTVAQAREKLESLELQATKEDAEHDRLKRQAIRGHRWPLPIAVKFDDGIDGSRTSKIMFALFFDIQLKTCITFDFNAKDPKDYIIFVPNNTCSSGIGYWGGKHTINLGSRCDASIVHETMHALGVWHEQSRSDRDDVVDVLWQNIEKKLCYNFDKKGDTTNEGLPYDFGSVMHYGSKFFSKNGEYTIRAKDPGYQHDMGQRPVPSLKDLMLLNRMYCKDMCNGPGPSCGESPDQGYRNPATGCQSCVCHPFLEGDNCNALKKSDWGCGSGEALMALSVPQTISTPVFGGNCYWTFYFGDESHDLLLHVTVNTNAKDVCKDNYVEYIPRHSNMTSTGYRTCSREPTTFVGPGLGGRMHFRGQPGVTAHIIYYKVKRSQQANKNGDADP